MQHEPQRYRSPSVDAQVHSPTPVPAELSLSVEKPKKKYNAGVPREAKSNSKLPSGDETYQPQSRTTRSHRLLNYKEGAAGTSPEPDSSDSFEWIKKGTWRNPKYGTKRENYVLDSGFLPITAEEFDNIPDPTVELTLEQLALLRRGFLTFYDFHESVILEIATALGEDKVHEGIFQRNRRVYKIHLVRYLTISHAKSLTVRSF